MPGINGKGSENRENFLLEIFGGEFFLLFRQLVPFQHLDPRFLQCGLNIVYKNILGQLALWNQSAANGLDLGFRGQPVNA